MSSDRGATAVAVQRLGVLIAAGATPLAAWRALASARGSPELVRTVADADSGHAISDRLARAATSPDCREWAPVAACWRVATETGAPLGPTLARLASVIRATDRAERQARAALAGPLATVRLLLLLPVAGLLLGALLGFDTVRILVATPPGWACLVVGAALLGGSTLWIRALVRYARRAPPSPGLAHELTAVALSAGLPPGRARRLVRETLDDLRLETSGDADATLEFAESAGVPAVALLRAEADDARELAAADAEERAGRLGVRVMVPLGVGILPAFVVLGVVPILLSLVGGLRIG